MSRMTNDVENVSNTIAQSLGSLVSGVLTVIGTVTIMFVYCWQLTLITMVSVIIMVFVTKKMSTMMRKVYRKRSQILGRLNGHSEEMITGLNLLMRFYQVDDGEIFIDGMNIYDIKRDELRKNIAIVLQDTVLFSDTIENNIKYSNPEASDQEMYYERLPQKYQTFLKQAGAGLSHGQRQLLAIARAVLANPKILILDEATSSVDTRTEQNIQDAMVKLMKNRTSLIIAHRLSAIRDADKIVVMDQGRVVEIGNHEELLEKKGKYYALYMTQFAGNKI